MSQKRVYTFGNGQAEGNAQMRELLGGKGANLAEMNHIGVPVPPGFTITTDTCNEYYKVGQEKIFLFLPASPSQPTLATSTTRLARRKLLKSCRMT